MRRHWWLDPLYWLFAAAPLAAAFWVFHTLPEMIDLSPTVAVPSGRAGVWVLPGVNALLAIVFYLLTGRMTEQAYTKAIEQERPTDIPQTLPRIRVFLMAWLSGVCGAVVYGYYVMDMGSITAALTGRVTAFVPGVGVVLFAAGLPRATKHSTLALRWRYSVRSPQVFQTVHKLGTPILYITGAFMVVVAFWGRGGLGAVLPAGLALGSALFVLYLYAKHLYDDEFRH